MPWSADRAQAPLLSLLEDDVLRQLNGGKHEIVQSLSIGPDALAQFSLQCLWAVAEGKLQADKLPMAVKATGIEAPLSGILAHVFWLVWSDIEGPNIDSFCEEITAPEAALDSEEAGRVIEALAECRRQNVITEQDVLEVLELSLLVQSGSCAPHSHRNSFARKIGLARNSRFLKIPTFNVFREELEGYSKLITLLNNPAVSQIENALRIRTEMDQLAGYYRLSPSKVASCILVAMEKDISTAPVRHLNVSISCSASA